MPFYAQEILLGLIGFAAAIIPLLLPSLRPLYRFILVAGGLCVACMLSGFLARLFFETDFTVSFIRAFLMIGLLQNIAVRMDANPGIAVVSKE